MKWRTHLSHWQNEYQDSGLFKSVKAALIREEDKKLCYKKGNWAQLFSFLLPCMGPAPGTLQSLLVGGRRPPIVGHLQPEGWTLGPHAWGYHGVCVPSPAPRRQYSQPCHCPFGCITWEMPARIKLFTQGHKTALQPIWESYLCLAMPSKASSPSLHSSSLRKELRMVK